MIATYEANRDKCATIFYRKQDNFCPKHFHRQIELMYVLKGKKSAHINNTDYELNENQILIVNSFDIHNFDKAEGDAQQIVLALPNRYAKRYDDFMSSKTLKGHIILEEAFCKSLLPIFTDMDNTEKIGGMLLESTIDYLLARIIEKLGYTERAVSGSHDLAENILSFIEEHFKENINLTELAEHFGYSKFYFSRLFNSMLGTSINDYISLIRLEHTLHTLKAEKCTVMSAALSNGFNSLQTFYRVYKANYGTSHV